MKRIDWEGNEIGVGEVEAALKVWQDLEYIVICPGCSAKLIYDPVRWSKDNRVFEDYGVTAGAWVYGPGLICKNCAEC